jgi:hypothetical protein
MNRAARPQHSPCRGHNTKRNLKNKTLLNIIDQNVGFARHVGLPGSNVVSTCEEIPTFRRNALSRPSTLKLNIFVMEKCEFLHINYLSFGFKG